MIIKPKVNVFVKRSSEGVSPVDWRISVERLSLRFKKALYTNDEALKKSVISQLKEQGAARPRVYIDVWRGAS